MKLKSYLEKKFGPSRKVTSSSSELRFNCPFCVQHGKTPDTKFHLYINTEKCVGQCKRCGEIVKISKDFSKLATLDFPSRPVQETSRRKCVKKLPHCVKIDTLSDPFSYLVSRFSDLMTEDEIYDRVEELGIRFCVDEKVKQHYHRLIFPVFYNSVLVGFQSRSIYGEEPKYLTENIGIYNVKDYLFNFDNALPFSRVFVFEGPLDVFPCGNECVALMGKQAKDSQIRLLSNNWKEVVICLDSDAVDSYVDMLKKLVDIVDRLGFIILESGDPGEIGNKVYGQDIYWVKSKWDILGVEKFLKEGGMSYEI